MHAFTSRLTIASALGLGLALAVPAVASAHVSVDTDTTAAGSYAVATFAIGHGCDGSPTTGVTIALPEGIEHATPTVNQGWTVSTTDDAVRFDAKEPLPDGVRDTFSIALVLAGNAGDTLVFPVTQQCESGQNDWVELPTADGSEPESPAPFVTLTAATEDAHGHGSHADADNTAAEPVTTGADPVARWLAALSLVAALAAVALGAVSLRRRAASSRG